MMNKNILLGVTGSVAAIKTVQLISELSDEGYEVIVAASEAALQFFDKSSIRVPIYTDKDELSWKKRGDDILHIKLKNWADVLLIAPMSANTLAKLASGTCDNLITCIARCWYFGDLSLAGTGQKFGIFAPAMNTAMWNNPLTARHVDTLCHTLGWHIITPISKTLMCGEVGQGAMEETTEIIKYIRNLVNSDT